MPTENYDVQNARSWAQPKDGGIGGQVFADAPSSTKPYNVLWPPCSEFTYAIVQVNIQLGQSIQILAQC